MSFFGVWVVILEQLYFGALAQQKTAGERARNLSVQAGKDTWHVSAPELLISLQRQNCTAGGLLASLFF